MDTFFEGEEKGDFLLLQSLTPPALRDTSIIKRGYFFAPLLKVDFLKIKVPNYNVL